MRFLFMKFGSEPSQTQVLIDKAYKQGNGEIYEQKNLEKHKIKYP